MNDQGRESVEVYEVEQGTDAYAACRELQVFLDANGGAAFMKATAEGRFNFLPRAFSLRRQLIDLGDYVGMQEHPSTNTLHEIDLRPWKGRDLDSTFIAVEWHYANPDLVGTPPPALAKLAPKLAHSNQPLV